MCAKWGDINVPTTAKTPATQMGSFLSKYLRLSLEDRVINQLIHL